MDTMRYTRAVSKVLADLPATRKAWGGLSDKRLPGGVPIRAVARPTVGPQCVTVSFQIDDRDGYLVLAEKTSTRLAMASGANHVRVYRDGRLIRMEFDLPREEWRLVKFSSLRHTLSRVVIGEKAVGGLAYLTWDDLPNKALFGLPGSGKTVCIVDMVMSMARSDPGAAEYRLVILNPKRERLFKPLCRLPHLAVPMADGYEASARALRWAVAEMERRKGDPARASNRLVVMADEVAQLVEVHPSTVDSVRKLAQFGRGMNMNVVIASQVANPSVFGPSGTKTKDLFGSRIVFQLGDEQAWMATGMGGQKTGFLGGNGDALAVNGGKAVRMRAALPSGQDYESLPRAEAQPAPPEDRDLAGDRALAVVPGEGQNYEIEVTHDFESGMRYTARFDMPELSQKLVYALEKKTPRGGRMRPVGADGIQSQFGGAMATARLLRDLAARMRIDAAKIKS